MKLRDKVARGLLLAGKRMKQISVGDQRWRLLAARLGIGTSTNFRLMT